MRECAISIRRRRGVEAILGLDAGFTDGDTAIAIFGAYDIAIGCRSVWVSHGVQLARERWSNTNDDLEILRHVRIELRVTTRMVALGGGGGGGCCERR